jgi:hypothetical protein
MDTRRIRVALLALLVLMLGATACRQGVRVGELQTETQVVERDGSDAVDVEIDMGAGELQVAGGAAELLEATFTYNVAELEPEATYANGRLEVRDQGVRASAGSLLDLRDFRNEWQLRLNEAVPLEMSVDLGAGRSHLDLGELALTRLDVNAGVGEATIDLTGDWQQDLDATISGGVGAIRVLLPAGAGVRVEVDTGIGAVNASGLRQDGNVYTNDAYGTAGVTLEIDIEGGVGEIRLEVQ